MANRKKTVLTMLESAGTAGMGQCLFAVQLLLHKELKIAQQLCIHLISENTDRKELREILTLYKTYFESDNETDDEETNIESVGVGNLE